MIGKAAGSLASQAEPRRAALHPTTRNGYWTALVLRCVASLISLLEELQTRCLGLGQAPVAATPSGESSFVEMDRSLDMAQARLDAVEVLLTGLAPDTPPAEPHERELREIRLLVAQLTADLLGADHPLVAQLASHERQRDVVAPAGSPLGSSPAGGRVHHPVPVITDQSPCD